MDLEQGESIGRGAVAHLFAGEAGEWEFEQLPAGEVVDELGGVALGVIAGRTAVSVVEDVDEHVGPRAGAVEPHRDAFAGRPVLADPGIDRFVLKAVDDSGERGDVHVELQNLVRRADGGQLGSRRSRGVSKSDRAACSVEGVEPDRRFAVGPCRQTAFEVVDQNPAAFGRRRALLSEGERPVVCPEVGVRTGGDDRHDHGQQLAVSASRGGCRVEYAVAAGEERVVVYKVGKRQRNQLPSSTGNGAGAGGRDDTVELELVIVGGHALAIAVVVVLEVDLQGVFLIGIGVDPHVEVVGARDVGGLGSTKAAEETGGAARAPAGFEREPAATDWRQIGGVGADATATDRTGEGEPAVGARVAVLHVVEHNLIEGGRAAAGERQMIEVDLDGRTLAALDTAEDDDHLVEGPLECSVATGSTIEEVGQRGADQRPVVIEVGRGEHRVEPDGVFCAVGPAVAVCVFSEGQFQGVAIDGGVGLLVDPDVEPGVGRHCGLCRIVDVAEGATVEPAGRSVAAPAGA